MAAFAALLPLPAHALDSGDVTGDITDPVLQSFSVSPDSADVTSADGYFELTLRVTDDRSGVGEVNFGWLDPAKRVHHDVNLLQVAGDDNDATFKGTFVVPRGSAAGVYSFEGSVADKVGNGRYWSPADLDGRGFDGTFDVADRDPDADGPTLTAMTSTPATVDVRSGDGELTVELGVSDEKSGILGAIVFVRAPDGTAGGADPPPMNQVSGDARGGTWRGTTTIPEHTVPGRWTFEVVLHDRLLNERRLSADELGAAGWPAGFDVLSNEDSTAPRLVAGTVSPIEIDVSDADRVVSLRLRVSDDLTGVKRYWADHDMHAVQADLFDPLSGQFQGIGGMDLVEGTALDGWYEGDIVVPKDSATGLRPLRVSTEDEVANTSWHEGVGLVSAGVPPAVLVYNTPLPPLPIAVEPGAGEALVSWDPPVDDRGAAITEYVLREQPQGIVTTVAGDIEDAVIDGLVEDINHRITIEAVNRAGASAPSAPLEVRVLSRSASVGVDGADAGGASAGSGYWMVGAGGNVYGFGDAGWMGNAAPGAASVDIEPTVTRNGYWVVDAAGRVSAFGDARSLGGGPLLQAGETVTSMSATPTGAGYWLFTNRGRALNYGDAPFFGDMSGTALNGPVLDSIATPSGRGYYLVASDGGVFAFGDARFAGSMGGVRLNAPVQSLVPDGDGSGYWLVASDGGIFAFDAPFYGSMGSTRLNRPVTGMVGSRAGAGYLMVGEDGGIFAFGDVPFHGSLGAAPPAAPITAVAAY